MLLRGEGIRQKQVELETMDNRSFYVEMLAQVNALLADKARFLAEINGAKEIIFDEGFSMSNRQLVERSSELFYVRRNQLESALQAKRYEVNVHEKTVQKVATRLLFSQKRLLLVQQQNEREKWLFKCSSNHGYDYLNNLKEINKLGSDITENEASLARSKTFLNQAISNLVATQNKYHEEASSAYFDVCGLLDQKVKRLKKYKNSLERTVLDTPIKSIIKELYVVTREGVIDSSGSDMAPNKEGVVVEAMLQPQDIDYIQQGQSAFIQLASGDTDDYGRLMGEVTSINPDPITTEDGEVYCIMCVTVDKPYFDKGRHGFKLSTGVLVTVGIITGKRSLLDYILSLLVSSLPFTLSGR